MSTPNPPPPVPGWMHSVVQQICTRNHGLRPREVLAAKRRHRPVMQEIAIELRARGASYPVIAACLGYRSHGTVHWLVNGRRKDGTK